MLFMTVRTFVDSNVLIYAYDLDAGSRRERSMRRLDALWRDRAGRLSTQVLQEFYVNATQKIRPPLNRSIARDIVRQYGAWVHSPITPATILRATEIADIWRLSFWDAMILSAAEQEEAVEVLSEDLNHGQVIAGVRVVNPFAN